MELKIELFTEDDLELLYKHFSKMYYEMVKKCCYDCDCCEHSDFCRFIEFVCDEVCYNLEKMEDYLC